LAIVRDGESNAACILVRLGVDLQELGSTVELHLGRGDHPVSGVLPKTPRWDKTRERAAGEASQAGAARIGTEHLLLGLLGEGGNVAAKVLANFGIQESAVRDQVARLGADDERREAGPEAPKETVLTCRITDQDRDILDTLVEAGFRTSRSDAAAWAIHAGLDAHQALVEKAVTALAEMRRLRDEVRSMAIP
jgi:ATP-dependent Clp protease ATP-binding subunit ClpA